MPLWVSDLLAFLALVLGIVLGVLLLYAGYVVVFRRHVLQAHPLYLRITQKLAWLEMPILVVAAGAAAYTLAVSQFLPLVGPFKLVSLSKPVPVASMTLEEAIKALYQLMPVAPFILALVAVRWGRTRWAAVALAAIALFGGGALVFQYDVHQFVKNSIGDQGSLFGLFGNSFYITVAGSIVIRLVTPLGVVLGALVGHAMIRRGWAFVLGGIVSGLAVVWVTSPGDLNFMSQDILGPPQTWKLYLTTSVASAILAVTLWALPHQRARLLDVAGFSEEEQPTTAAAGARYVFVCLSTLSLVLAVGLGKVEQDAIEVFSGPPQTPRSPVLVNAWDVMAERYNRKANVTNQVPKLFNYLSKDGWMAGNPLHSVDSLDVIREKLTPEIRAGFAAEIDKLAPWVSAYEAGAQADYLSPYTNGEYTVPSYLNLREVSRWLALRCRIRCVDGDWQGALEDMRTVHRFSALEADGTLVTHMIMTAIRGIGNSMGEIYWQAFRDDPAAMRAMADALNETAPGNLRSFPVDNIRRYEPGTQPIVPFADIAVPSFLRATTIFQRNQGQFGHLRIAAALERYRHEHGSYPETLDALVPIYLPRVPRDSFDGKPLFYEVTETGLVLDSERHHAEGRKPGKRSDLLSPLNLQFAKSANP